MLSKVMPSREVGCTLLYFNEAPVFPQGRSLTLLPMHTKCLFHSHSMREVEIFLLKKKYSYIGEEKGGQIPEHGRRSPGTHNTSSVPYVAEQN